MGLTLLEAAKLNRGDVQRAAIIRLFAEASDLLAALPFDDISGNSLSYNVEGALPGIAFRGFNEGYTASTGIINPETEVLRIAGGELDVDKALIKTRGEGIRAVHEAMKVEALSLSIADKLINGDSAVDPKEFDGLRKRVGGAQLFPANLSAPTANSPLSLEAVDEAIDAVHQPTHLIMSKNVRNKLTVASRKNNVGGDIEWSKDEFGRRIAFYNDLPILIADYSSTGERIIDYNEAGPAGGVDSTSMYVASFGDGKVQGIQNGGIDVNDLGELETLPVMRTRVEWLVGLTVMHPRALARVYGIQNAPVTA